MVEHIEDTCAGRETGRSTIRLAELAGDSHTSVATSRLSSTAANSASGPAAHAADTFLVDANAVLDVSSQPVNSPHLHAIGAQRLGQLLVLMLGHSIRLSSQARKSTGAGRHPGLPLRSNVLLSGAGPALWSRPCPSEAGPNRSNASRFMPLPRDYAPKLHQSLTNTSPFCVSSVLYC